MNDSEVSRQINQMVQFIKQEAEEKAHEISVAAEEEFNIEKLQVVETEKQKIRKEYERKEGQVDVKKKIEHSTALNAMRLKVLTAREEIMRSLVNEATRRLAGVASSPNYKQLLTDLIVQGLDKLQEKSVVVRVRQADIAAAKDAVDAAKKLRPAVTINLDSAFLNPPPNPAAPDTPYSLGGCVVLSADGKLKVSNTLEDRLHVTYEANVPTLRTKIYGKSGGQLRV